MTIVFGTWLKYNSSELSLRQGIDTAVGVYTTDHDMDASEKDYRNAISAQLGDLIQLVGDEFHGSEKFKSIADEAIRQALILVNMNFWNILAKHHKHLI